MSKEHEIIIIKSRDGGYVAYPRLVPGCIVQAEEISEIPRQLGEAFAALMVASIQLKDYKIVEVIKGKD